MTGDGVTAVFRDVSDRLLEALVRERLDLAAVVADDVVVVLLVMADGLEAGDPVAQIDSLHEALLGEHVEHAVDARQPDRLAARAKLAVDLLRTETAALPLEEVDHPYTREPPPVARRPQLVESTL